MNYRCSRDIALLLCFALALVANNRVSAHAAEREKVMITSTADGTEQPSYVILPDGFDPAGDPVPLLVSLHNWSGNGEQRHKDLEADAARRGWIYLFPHFRGPNETPEACGSPLAQQDILDAVDWVLAHYPIDRHRIYLTGASGGGHMAMLMAGRHPERWTAVSAWVGISDLADWEKFHGEKRYGPKVRAACGGAPGASAEVDREYFNRSPINHLHNAVGLPLDLAAGVHDGHTGSVPIRHTLNAFNVVAKAQGAPLITPEEINQLSRPDGRLDHPQPGNTVEDPMFGRAIYLRRTAGNARVTIFEGGHERIDRAAIEWLSRQVSAEPK